MKTGIELIAGERERQITTEGWTEEHDDMHIGGEMAGAAIQYASLVYSAAPDFKLSTLPKPMFWPWDAEWWKPSDDLTRNLVKAGALIAAEIDRLQRKASAESSNSMYERPGANT